ncbi:unnamed protein product [Allacma fusca]|uniref:Uncharacterized protein n=1 Tax=Allacma fusca TaxID=39272 RepID=A0A8J2LJD0_9HEXA|nr:unnamed protein product [Allacma fusca]
MKQELMVHLCDSPKCVKGTYGNLKSHVEAAHPEHLQKLQNKSGEENTLETWLGKTKLALPRSDPFQVKVDNAIATMVAVDESDDTDDESDVDTDVDDSDDEPEVVTDEPEFLYGWDYLGCLVHKLQLVVKTAIENDPVAKQFILSINAIITMFRTSPKLMSKLLKTDKNLLAIGQTKWNSIYFALERISDDSLFPHVCELVKEYNTINANKLQISQ